jgi:predicted phage tail protein
MYYPLPTDPAKQAAMMNRFMRENLSVETNIQGTRRRPQPVRGLTALAGTKQVTLNWAPPQNAAGIVGYNVYQGNENTRIANIANVNTLQWLIQGLTTGVAIAFYVSAYNALLESVKLQIVSKPL